MKIQEIELNDLEKYKADGWFSFQNELKLYFHDFCKEVENIDIGYHQNNDGANIIVYSEKEARSIKIDINGEVNPHDFTKFIELKNCPKKFIPILQKMKIVQTILSVKKELGN